MLGDQNNHLELAQNKSCGEIDVLVIYCVRTSKHLSRLTGNHATDSYCAVLEDDLVLAPDALIYLQASSVISVTKIIIQLVSY